MEQVEAETRGKPVETTTLRKPGNESPQPLMGTTSSLADNPEGTLEQKRPRRFHGTVVLDPTRVGRDAGRIAEEVIAHLAGQVGADVTVTLEIEATLPDGATEQIVRTVTENSRTLKFSNHGFERE